MFPCAGLTQKRRVSTDSQQNPFGLSGHTLTGPTSSSFTKGAHVWFYMYFHAPRVFSEDTSSTVQLCLLDFQHDEQHSSYKGTKEALRVRRCHALAQSRKFLDM